MRERERETERQTNRQTGKTIDDLKSSLFSKQTNKQAIQEIFARRDQETTVGHKFPGECQQRCQFHQKSSLSHTGFRVQNISKVLFPLWQAMEKLKS